MLAKLEKAAVLPMASLQHGLWPSVGKSGLRLELNWAKQNVK